MSLGYNYLTTFVLFYQYYMYKILLKSNKLEVSFNIVNVFYNFFLFKNGLLGVLYPNINDYANNIIYIHKSAQVVNLINEIPRGNNRLLILHHILILIIMHNIKLDIHHTPFLICLYGGLCEISSVLYALMIILDKTPYLKNNYNYVDFYLKLMFLPTFFIIRGIVWSMYTPFVTYNLYSALGLNITVCVLPIFQLMQYYWIYLIYKKTMKYFMKKEITDQLNVIKKIE